MPIRPENRGRYPADWPTISQRIRFERAQGQCECEGECGSVKHRMHLRLVKWADETDPRCPAQHGKPHPWSGSNVVLTTAHLDHVPEHCDDANLKAMCQGCHLNYDREHHAQTRAATRHAKEAHQ